MSETDNGSIREAVAVFHNAETLEAAIDDLQEHGFDRAAISLLAGEKAVDRELKRHFVRAKDLEDDPHTPRAAYVSRESLGAAEGALIGGLLYVVAVPAAGAIVASAGAIGAALLAAVLAGGAGAGLGAILARFIDAAHAKYIERQVDKGGLLLWVRVFDDEQERRARMILSRHAAEDVHTHAMPLGFGEQIPYGGEIIEKYPCGIYFTCGRLFESLDAAKRHLEDQTDDSGS